MSRLIRAWLAHDSLPFPCSEHCTLLRTPSTGHVASTYPLPIDAGNLNLWVALARKGLQSSAVVQSCSRRARSFRSGSAATDAARRRSPDDPRSSPGRARLPTSPAHAPPGQQSSPAPSANAADTSEPADASDAHPKASAAGSASSILKLTFHTLHSPCPRLAPRATAASARSDAPTTTAAACSPPLAAAAHR